jgi:hypothetical protein
MEREHTAREYNWATLSLEDRSTETWSSRLGVRCRADDLTQYKTYCFSKSKDMKAR